LTMTMTIGRAWARIGCTTHPSAALLIDGKMAACVLAPYIAKMYIGTLVGVAMKLFTVLLLLPPDQHRGHGVRSVVGRLASRAAAQHIEEPKLRS
jgi:hypothetical protein